MVLPLGDDNTGRVLFPAVTIALIAVNVVVFLIELSQGTRIEGFFQTWAVVPAEYTARTDLPPTQPFPFWATIFTSMFMHGGFMHIGGNMLYLWVFGDNIEDNFGHAKFLIFYLICGVVATFSQIALDPQSPIPTLGASGAIAGVLGAYLIMFPHNRIRTVTMVFIWTIIELPALVVLGFWIVIQFFSQFAAITEHTAQSRGGGVAYMAHIGGFVAGLLLSFLFRRKRKEHHYYE